MIEFQTIVFYCFSAVALTAGLGVVLVSNPVYAALFLVLAFVASAGIWLLLYAEFLAIALVLVYVGAVMVLFLFVLMMLDINVDRLREGFWRHLPLALLVIVLFAAELIAIVSHQGFVAEVGEAAVTSADNTRALGAVLYTQYVYPFELAAVILLVAIVAAVALTLRRRKNTKYADPAAQVRARASERVRLVTMPAERAFALSDNDSSQGGQASARN